MQNLFQMIKNNDIQNSLQLIKFKKLHLKCSNCNLQLIFTYYLFKGKIIALLYRVFKFASLELVRSVLTIFSYRKHQKTSHFDIKLNIGMLVYSDSINPKSVIT